VTSCACHPCHHSTRHMLANTLNCLQLPCTHSQPLHQDSTPKHPVAAAPQLVCCHCSWFPQVLTEITALSSVTAVLQAAALWQVSITSSE
jgi:hypothetical protein